MSPEPTHQFTDEWLLRAMLQLPGVTEAVIDKLRKEKAPYLAQALVRGKLADPGALAQSVLDSYGISYMDVQVDSVDKATLMLVPEKVCRKHHLIPVSVDLEEITVLMAYPLDQTALADVQATSGRRPLPRYCLKERVDALVAELYSPESVVNGLVERLAEDAQIEVLNSQQSDEDETPETVRQPVIRLANSIVAKAVKMRASDIHIEHEERSSSVRCRVDGMLKTVMALPRSIASTSLVSRIKIMSNLDLTEHRKPQDGRAKLRLSGVEIGLRVSTLPTAFGEKVVIRILDKRAAEVPFEKLGFQPELAARIDTLLKAAQGIFLVTGPTGSGKTTTLYSILNRMKSDDTNIVTAEDPIEYKLTGINQVQVNEKAGLNFAAVLRSVLRQDPDIILVGEIRDKETADIAFQAALTGHMVLSTLHTNDALSTIARLSDMGIERFKIAPGLIAITAQRLVRRLCPACKTAVPADKANPAALDLLRRNGLAPTYFIGKGCQECEFSGIKGRMSVLELLEVSAKIKERIVAGAEEAALREIALAEGALHTLEADSAWHMAQGHVSFEELMPYLSAPKAPPKAASAPPPGAAPRSEGPVREQRPAQDSAPAGGPEKILIVDDELANRFILKKLLEGNGYHVAEAHDGLQALDRLSEAEPDLMLLDLKMPHLDGYGVLKAARETLGMTALPIIILSTMSDDKSQEEAFAIGADDFVTKPFKAPLLLARIKAAIRRKNL